MVNKKEKDYGSCISVGRNRSQTCYMQIMIVVNVLKKKIKGNVKVKGSGGSLDKAIKEVLSKNMSCEPRP